MKICKYCGIEFEPNKYAGDRQQCCCKAHAKRYYREHKRKRYTFVCKYCGEEYQTIYKDRDQYCSRECAFQDVQVWHRGVPSDVEKTCIFCGRVFTGRPGQKFCSDACRTQYVEMLKRQLSDTGCAFCGSPLTMWQVQHGTQFCTISCAARAQFTEKMNTESGEKCLQCGKPLPLWTVERGAHFCSAKCNYDYQSSHPSDEQCEHCGKALSLQQAYHEQRFCSEACAYASVAIEATCDWCGARYMKGSENQRFCGDHCLRAYHKAKRNALKRNNFVEDVTIKQLVNRDGSVCGICGMPIDMQLEFPDLDCATIDHVVPVSRNGEHSLGNTQLAHFRCNIWKSDRLPDALAAD